MSFSGEVKEELARHMGKGRHCQIAELAAIFVFGGDTPLAEPENPHARRKRALLLKELFGIEDGVIGHLEKRVFETVRMWDGETETTADGVDGILIQQTCGARFWQADRSAIRRNPITLRLYRGICVRPHSLWML